MTRKLTAVILALFACLTLVSCRAPVKEDPEDFEFTSLTGIPLADIKIAYIHADVTELKRDVTGLIEKHGVTEGSFTELDVSAYESTDGVFSELLAKGYNVFFLDRSLPEELIASFPKDVSDVYVISHGNDLPASKGTVSFENDFLEYSYLLGVIAAESHGAESIGVFTDSALYYPEINAFAAGVWLVNSNIKVTVSDKMQTLTQNRCEAVFIPHSSAGYAGNTRLELYGFDSAMRGNFLSSDYSKFFDECLLSVVNGSFAGASVSLGTKHGSMDQSLARLGLSEELMEKVSSVKDYFASGMPVFSENQLMLSGDKVISVREAVIDNRGNTVIDDSGNYYYYSGEDLLACESYAELVGGKMNYYMSNVEIK